MEREPRLPMDPPPPTRAQAFIWKVKTPRNMSVKRTRKPLVKFFHNICFLR